MDNQIEEKDGTSTEPLTMPHVIQLKYPRSVGSKVIDEVTFRNEPTGAMTENLPVGNMKQGDFYPIISKMTGETLDLVRKMHPHDIVKCMKAASVFLDIGQTPDQIS